MSPQDALKILDEVGAQTNTTRMNHIQIQQAIAVLANVVNPRPAYPEVKED